MGLVTASAVAGEVGVHEKTVRNWAIARRIPSYRGSRRSLRFKPEEVLRAIRRAPAGEGTRHD